MSTESIVWISGGSGGIGAALARTVPWAGARLISISRRPAEGMEHLEADLTQPSAWQRVGEAFRRELAGFGGERVVFVHAAGTLDPIGFAGEVDDSAYVANVVLNSAAPQALGHLFLAAASRSKAAERHLVMLTSGAARSVYPGWTSYGAGKAAIDQWVRDAGAEQELRGGVKVVAIGPGTVATRMQQQLRETDARDFPQRQKFVDLHAGDRLAEPDDAARDIWAFLDRGLENGAVVDVRDLAKKS